jgi:hypothetical protein
MWPGHQADSQECLDLYLPIKFNDLIKHKMKFTLSMQHANIVSGDQLSMINSRWG